MPAPPASSPAVPGRRRRFTLRRAVTALFVLCLGFSIWTQDLRAVMLFLLGFLLYLFIGVGEWRDQQDR
ncbi:MAG TPA: hypothetical protein VNK82_08445 [Terriglobales bacterium]|nr:hypothetical protein [Terriglobales bacterium]